MLFWIWRGNTLKFQIDNTIYYHTVENQFELNKSKTNGNNLTCWGSSFIYMQMIQLYNKIKERTKRFFISVERVNVSKMIRSLWPVVAFERVIIELYWCMFDIWGRYCCYSINGSNNSVYLSGPLNKASFANVKLFSWFPLIPSLR